MANRKDRKTVFAVWTNSDLTEGRGREYVELFTKLESTARRLAQGNYVMGTNSRVTEETMHLIDGRWYAPSPNIVEPTAEDVREEEKIKAAARAAKAKAAAIARAKALGLTEAEIAALNG